MSPGSVIQFSFEGTPALRRILRKMPGQVRKKATRKAAKAGAEIIRSQAAQNAPVDKGVLRENVGTKVGIRRISDAGEVSVDIGATKHAWYGWLLEVGTEFIVAIPWLRPAFDEKKNAAILAVRRVFFTFLEKYAKKQRKKGIKI